MIGPLVIITNDIRALMAQSELDGPDVKQLKWDFWTLQRMTTAYRDICLEQQVDLVALQHELIDLVAIASNYAKPI